MSSDSDQAKTQFQVTDLDQLAHRLEATGDYKILRRMQARQATPTPADYTGKIGIMLDVETTGLDTTKDEIIEIAMVKFRYSDNDEIIGVSDTFQAFNQPSNPIPAEVTELTGITDTMVAGQKIDAVKVKAFVADADIVVAHNANFDRRFAERAWQFFEHKPWACSMSQIDWKAHGYDGAKLGYLLAGAGLFHDAHRAIDDCHALVEILSHPRPGTSRRAFGELMNNARRKTSRVWAQRAPFDLKDVLKARKYRWNDGSDGRPKSWYIDVDASKRDDELKYLRQEIYQREIEINCRDVTAFDRFSNRT